MVISSNEWERLIGHNIAPNYYVVRNTGWVMFAELCSLAEVCTWVLFKYLVLVLAQCTKPAKISHLCSETLSRKGQWRWGGHTEKG